MRHIETAMERFKAYCKSKGIPEKSSLAHIHKMSQFEEHERKELRTALEASQEQLERLNGLYHSEVSKHQLDYNALQAENAEQAKRIDEIKEVMEQSSALDKYEIVERVNSTLAEKFCDSNCTWLDHHKDCKLSAQKGTE